MKNIKPFQSYGELNEDGGADLRAKLKQSVKAFMKAQSELESAYKAMKSSGWDILTTISNLNDQGDFDAANTADKVFGSLEGNYLFVLKDSLNKYYVDESSVKKIYELGAHRPDKFKVPKSVPLDQERFEKMASFLSSKFKETRNEYVGYMANYGLSHGPSPSFSGWFDDPALRDVRNAMSEMMQKTKDLSESDLAKINDDLSELGFVIHKVSKEYRYITFKRTR